jgi:hypothetical protein
MQRREETDEGDRTRPPEPWQVHRPQDQENRERLSGRGSPLLLSLRYMTRRDKQGAELWWTASYRDAQYLEWYSQDWLVEVTAVPMMLAPSKRGC